MHSESILTILLILINIIIIRGNMQEEIGMKGPVNW